jgi:hypothetical protein
METKFIEAGNRQANDREFNWGKFMVAKFTDEEWLRFSEIGHQSYPLLYQVGWERHHVIVFDLQTCEGAGFRPGGYAKADLDKHRIWVCPLYEPFLAWLYKQKLDNLSALPNVVDLDAPGEYSGYRRSGPLNE